MPMDYFVWAIVGRDRTIVVDTGFNTLDARTRNRRLLRTAAEGLALIGVDASEAPTVILTHLHYDHVGGFDQFPNARLHVQDREMAFATGRHARPDQPQGHLCGRRNTRRAEPELHAELPRARRIARSATRGL